LLPAAVAHRSQKIFGNALKEVMDWQSEMKAAQRRKGELSFDLGSFGKFLLSAEIFW
jgi:hypothetical protein